MFQTMDTNTTEFNCASCERSFTSKRSLHSHVVHYHNRKSVKRQVACPVCSETFNSRNYLQLHIRNTHGVPIKNDMLLVTGIDTKYRFKCIFCKKDYGTERSLKRHIVKHGVPIEEYLHLSKGMNAKLFKCLFCKNCYQSEAMLKKHMGIHGVTIEDNTILVVAGASQKCFKCTICGTSFNSDRNLKIHMQRFHGCSLDLTKGKICPGCDEIFRFYDDLRFHISTIHGIPIEVEEHQFKTLTDFNEWKHEMEMTTGSYYNKRSAVKSKLNSSKMFLKYECDRSRPVLKAKRIKRPVNTKRIIGCCPSSINVVATAEGFGVKFHKTHYGHPDTILRNSEHPYLADVNPHKISKNSSIKKSNNKDQLQSQCIHANHEDIQCSKKRIRHPNGHTSIKSWVAAMKCAEDDSQIVYYKKVGDIDTGGILGINDFQLVIMTKLQEKVSKKYDHLNLCIDSTRSTQSGDFHLITILAVDEFGCGCPMAVCLSNRIDEKGIEAFFIAIREKLGIIQVNAFMSDDVPEFYNAWSKVMEASHHQFLCPWYVSKKWCKKLKKIRNLEKRTNVYDTLEALLQVTDQEEFELYHSEIVAALFADRDTRRFECYFKKYYSGRCTLWASCYRSHLEMNTTGFLESTHKTLKDLHLEWKEEKNIGSTLSKLLKICQGECLKRLIGVTENVSDSQVKTRENHVKSKEILDSMIIQIEKNHWLIQYNAGSRYNVKKLENAPCRNNCKPMCHDCDICIHMYECMCLDNSMRFIICEHIHACASRCTSSIEADCDKNAEMTLAPDACEEANTLNSSEYGSNFEKETDHLMDEMGIDTDNALDTEETNLIKNVHFSTDVDHLGDELETIETLSGDDTETIQVLDMCEKNLVASSNVPKDDEMKAIQTVDVLDPCEETNSLCSLDFIKNLVQKKLEYLQNEIRNKTLSKGNYFEFSKSLDYCMSLYSESHNSVS